MDDFERIEQRFQERRGLTTSEIRRLLLYVHQLRAQRLALARLAAGPTYQGAGDSAFRITTAARLRDDVLAGREPAITDPFLPLTTAAEIDPKGEERREKSEQRRCRQCGGPLPSPFNYCPAGEAGSECEPEDPSPKAKDQ